MKKKKRRLPKKKKKKKDTKANPNPYPDLVQGATWQRRWQLCCAKQIVNSVAHFIAWAFSQFLYFFGFFFFLFLHFNFFAKSALIVTIFVQQLHFGFFEHCKLKDSAQMQLPQVKGGESMDALEYQKNSKRN